MIDRGDAVNLAWQIRETDNIEDITRKGILTLVDAVLRMDAHIADAGKKVAHSKSEYKRLTDQGENVLPPSDSASLAEEIEQHPSILIDNNISESRFLAETDRALIVHALRAYAGPTVKESLTVAPGTTPRTNAALRDPRWPDIIINLCFQLELDLLAALSAKHHWRREARKVKPADVARGPLTESEAVKLLRAVDETGLLFKNNLALDADVAGFLNRLSKNSAGSAKP